MWSKTLPAASAAVILILSLLQSTSTNAQEFDICGPGSQQVSTFDQWRSALARFIQFKPAQATPATSATPVQDFPNEEYEQPDEESGPPKFGWYGYGHTRAHDEGWIQQLLDATHQKCCDSGEGGECRISSVDMIHKLVLIDGMWCPLAPPTFATIEGMDGAVTLVCAGKTNRNMRKAHHCPSQFCIGRAQGG